MFRRIHWSYFDCLCNFIPFLAYLGIQKENQVHILTSVEDPALFFISSQLWLPPKTTWIPAPRSRFYKFLLPAPALSKKAWLLWAAFRGVAPAPPKKAWLTAPEIHFHEFLLPAHITPALSKNVRIPASSGSPTLILTYSQ